MKRFGGIVVFACLFCAITFVLAPGAGAVRPVCSDPELNALCTEAADSIGYAGEYTGHDEPSLLFYSNSPGSGNSSSIRSPPERPEVQPNQAARRAR